MRFGENLRRIREMRGMSVAELASRIGTTRQTVYRYESGYTYNVTADRIMELAAVLDVAPGVLVGWEEDFQPDPFAGIGILTENNGFTDETGYVTVDILADEEQKKVGAFVPTAAIPMRRADTFDAEVCCIAPDDSMAHSHIFKDDRVFIKRGGSPENGDVTAFYVDGCLKLRRYYYNEENDQVMLVADNAPEAPLVLPMAEAKRRMTYVGTVVGTHTSFRKEDVQ